MAERNAYRYYVDGHYWTPEEMDRKYGPERGAALRTYLDKHGSATGPYNTTRYESPLSPWPVPREMQGGIQLDDSNSILRSMGFPDDFGTTKNKNPMTPIPMVENIQGQGGADTLLGKGDSGFFAQPYSMTREDKQAIADVSAEFGIQPDELLTVIYNETAGSLNPDRKNYLGYQGLIQFGPPRTMPNGKWNPGEQAEYGYEVGMGFAKQVYGPVRNYLIDRGLPRGASYATLYKTIHGGSPTVSDKKTDVGTGLTIKETTARAYKDWNGRAKVMIQDYDPLTGKLRVVEPDMRRLEVQIALPRERPEPPTDVATAAPPEFRPGAEPAMLPGGERLPPKVPLRVQPTTVPKIIEQIRTPGPKRPISEADRARMAEETFQLRSTLKPQLGDEYTQLSIDQIKNLPPPVRMKVTGTAGGGAAVRATEGAPLGAPVPTPRPRPPSELDIFREGLKTNIGITEGGRTTVRGRPETEVGRMPPRLPVAAHPPGRMPVRMRVTGVGETTVAGRPDVDVGRLPVNRPPEQAHPPVGLPIRLPISTTTGIGMGASAVGKPLGAMVPTPRERPNSDIDALTWGLSNVEGTPGITVRPRPDDRVQVTAEKPLAGVPDVPAFPSATHMKPGFMGPDPSGIEKAWSYKDVGGVPQSRPALNSVGYVGSGPLGFDDVATMVAENTMKVDKGIPAPSYAFPPHYVPEPLKELMPEIPEEPVEPEPEVAEEPSRPEVERKIRIQLPNIFTPPGQLRRTERTRPGIHLNPFRQPMQTSSEAYTKAGAYVPPPATNRLAPSGNVATTPIRFGSPSVATSPSGGPGSNYQLSTDSGGRTVISWQGSQGQTIHAYQDSQYGTGSIHGLDRQSGGLT